VERTRIRINWSCGVDFPKSLSFPPGSNACHRDIPENIQFAISLCLEEVVSNIIRHGYAGEEDHSVIIRFTMPRSGQFVFVIDDEAPHFNPLDAPDLSPLNPREEIRVGGQGIRFLRRFADTIEYEPIPSGNRLRVGFSARNSALGSK
jgi:serine/threonine-protein kinase RsbW